MTKLEIRYIPLADAVLWEDNQKLHDFGALVTSIKRYGFRDAPIFDETLKCIVAGNGRITTLAMLKKGGEKPPKGITLDPTGEWLVPIQFGINSPTKENAESFALDHNNLVLPLSEMSPSEVAKMYDTGYAKLAQRLTTSSEPPISITATEARDLLAGIEPTQAKGKEAAGKDPDPSSGLPVIVVLKVAAGKGTEVIAELASILQPFDIRIDSK